MGKSGRSMLSDEPRIHSVNLERVLRGHLGLIDEPMEFTAESIASMLEEIADECDPTSAFELHAVVRALRGEDKHHRLVLQQVKRGKFVSPTERSQYSERALEWLRALAILEHDGLKTEAAVADIARRWQVSRASIFAGIKHAERLLEMGRSIERFSDSESGAYVNPRPSKNENG